MNGKKPDEIAFEEIESVSSNISEKDLDKIVSRKKNISDKSSKLDLNKFRKFINQIRLALSLIRDFRNKSYTNIPWRSIAMLAAAVLYFVNPFDLVPDILPVLGFTDDAILFAALFKSIQSDLEKYCEWKGLNPDKYF